LTNLVPSGFTETNGKFKFQHVQPILQTLFTVILACENYKMWRCVGAILTLAFVAGRSIITKKGEGSQVKESTDSSTTIEEDDVKGKAPLADAAQFLLYQNTTSPLYNFFIHYTCCWGLPLDSFSFAPLYLHTRMLY
jgi:hypothetical protein